MKVLRPAKRSDLVSARVFDAHFEQNLQPAIDVQPVEIIPWLDAIFGSSTAPSSPAATAAAFREATREAEFLCPDHHGIPLLPRLAALRNRSGARVRLLVIAHSPAVYLLDWALLRPLLRPGDRIVAPTRSARATIALVCRALEPFVRVVPHPIRPLTASGSRAARAVMLGRLVPAKLVHRILDAVDGLRRRGTRLRVDVAGPLSAPGSDAVQPYVRALRSRIRRLGLEDQVRLLGLVEGESAKAQLFAGAAMLLNLSVSLEESFGKSVVEALGCGVPSLVTRWDGLPETAGTTAACVEVSDELFAMDVAPERLADAMERLLDVPPCVEACLAQARHFGPDQVAPRYREMLDEALAEHRRMAPAREDIPGEDEPAAPSEGLLATAAPLNAYAWRDLFRVHEEEFESIRREIAGHPRERLSEGGHVRTRLFLGQRGALESFFAGFDPHPRPAPTGTALAPPRPGAGLLDRMEHAMAGRATRSSRIVCLDFVCAARRTAAARAGLEWLRSEGLSSPGLDFLEVELLSQEGRLEEALETCLRPEDPSYWNEHAAHRLRQLARVAWEGGAPERALPRLQEWTQRFPDASDAGDVWLARCICALHTGARAEAHECLARAGELLGDTRGVSQLARLLDSA